MFRRQLLLLSGLLAVVYGCAPKDDGTSINPQPVVRVVEPVEKPVTDFEYFTGRADAVDSVEVRSRVTGYLVAIEFKAGQEVKKGQRLFKIDPRPYQATLDQATAQQALNEAQRKYAVAEYARVRQLSRTPGAISTEDVDKAGAAQAQAEASVQAAKANVESADLNLKFTDISAPIDGIVGRNLLTIGNLVNQDSTLLTTIVSTDPMYGYFDIDEPTMLRIQAMIRGGKLRSIREGGEYRMQFGLATEGEEFPHEGTLDFVNNQVDPSTGTIQVRAVLPNPKPAGGGSRLLTPGLFLRVRLPVGLPHEALLVPQAALGTDQGNKYLLVVNDKNVVEYRPVNVGPLQPKALQVVEPIPMVKTEQGLRQAREGEKGEPSITKKDRVIVSGLQRVRPGMTVEAKPLESAGANR